MTAEHIDQMLGPEPVIEEQAAEAPVENVSHETEQPSEQIAVETPEPASIESKQTPEQITENYKRMAHAERMERKQLQNQMRTMQERFEQLMQAAKVPEPAEPEYDEDPLGATHTKVDKVLREVADLKAENRQKTEIQQFEQIVNNIKADEAQFAAKTPDYKDAINFIQNRRMIELSEMGYDEQSIMGILAKDALALTQRAAQLGESPAKFAYNMAKKVGYTSKQQGSIDKIAAGQEVAKSVAGGSVPVSEGSLPNNLAEMSDAEFEKLMKQMKV